MSLLGDGSKIVHLMHSGVPGRPDGQPGRRRTTVARQMTQLTRVLLPLSVPLFRHVRNTGPRRRRWSLCPP
ncbi:hypothetical protein BN9982_2330002 [Mycobacterium tuberculosis]|nr:hypothetical protein BN9982_2330002 [Mycobacterium tuberculosis]